MMQIEIDNILKKTAQKNARKEHKGIYYLWIFERFVLVASISFLVLFPIYCAVTRAYVATISRTGKESYGLVFFITAIVVGMSLTAWLLLSVLRMRLEHAFIGGRVDEVIEIIDNNMFYTFRIQYQTLSDERNLVIVDLNQIEQLTYDAKLGKIILTAKMVEKVINISANMHNVDESEMVSSTLEIRDYFVPSLHSELKKYVGQEGDI